MNYAYALLISLITLQSAVAATPVDLQQQPPHYLQKHFSTHDKPIQFKKMRADLDLKQVVHTRLQQSFNNIPVWNASATVHTPLVHLQSKNHTQTTITGLIYEDLEQDLHSTSIHAAFNDKQKSKALHEAKQAYAQKNHLSQSDYRNESVKPIIYIDNQQKAHYAYLVNFATGNSTKEAAVIVDAVSLAAYRV